MNIGRKFWTVTRWARAARFWLFVALAALAYFGLGDAHAQTGYENCNVASVQSANCPDKQAAYAAAKAAVEAYISPSVPGQKACLIAEGSEHVEYAMSTYLGPAGGSVCPPVGTPQTRKRRTWPVGQICPTPGGVWDNDAKRCHDPEQCLARNGAANGMPAIETARPFKERCVDGCQLKMEGPGSCTSILGQAGSTMCAGVFQYSGNVCSATPPEEDPSEPPPPEPEETCKDAASGGGLKVCKKKDGQECVSTKTGVSICWGTHETGEKSIGNEQQARSPGTDEPNPTPPTPPETFDPAQKTDPVTTQTTTTNPNGSTTTTTVTTVSNGTTNGTQPPGTPVAPGGGGGGQPGQGEDDEGNSASGGGNCETPPVVEGDAALGMIAKQAWETRCALEKIGKGAKVTGDVGDCDSPFTVEGDDASAKQLRAMRAQICPGGEAAKNGDGDAIDGSGIDGPDSAEGSGVFVTETFGEEGLNTVGLGFSRTCPVMPQITVLGNVIQFDNSVMCQWLELGGQILLILSALVSVRIMAGVGT